MARQIQVKNPRTGQADYSVNAVGCEAISTMANEMREAQKHWRNKGLQARCEALTGLADALDAASASIIQALEIDTGRRQISKQEVQGVIFNIRAWAVRAPELMPDSLWKQGQSKPDFKHRNEYIPYALIGVISPWNFPMTLSLIDAIPALLAGCTVIIKPSEVTPRFADALTPIIEKAGMSDVLKFIQGDGETGGYLIDHVDSVCFTGSVPTGRKVAVRAAQNLIPANLELGGKDPLIITEDADIDVATTLALRASILATGQACQSIERIYVPQTIYKDFAILLAKKAEAVELTFPDIEKGQIGPFIYDRQAAIVYEHIQDAVSKGAQVLSGGEILRHGGGYWMEPTVLVNVNHTMKVMHEETFGPVMPVMAYEHLHEALSLANDTEFGLSGAVYSASVDEAAKIGKDIDAGAISLMDAALTGQYFEAGKQSFKHSGLGPSRMGAEGFLRFFRQKAYIANTAAPLTLDDFS